MAKDKQDAEGGLSPDEVLAKVTEALAAQRDVVTEMVRQMRNELLQEVARLVAKEIDGRVVEGTWMTSELIPADDGPQPLTAAEQDLISRASAAYGIAAKFLFAANIDRATGEAVLVTHGGAKVRYATDQKVEPLGQVRITGINPNPKRRQITGAKK